MLTIPDIIQGKPKDRMAGGAEEFNAFFYSLVSTDTQVSRPGALDCLLHTSCISRAYMLC